MAPQRSVDTVRHFYDLLGQGKLEEAGQLFHEDLIIHEAPELPFGGDFHGPQGFFDIWARIVEFAEPSLVGEMTYLDTEPVVVLLRGRFTRKSGEAAETDVVELYSVRDGQIVDLDIYYKNPGAVAALVGR
jgi:ketosteroid isomerase-like protein